MTPPTAPAAPPPRAVIPPLTSDDIVEDILTVVLALAPNFAGYLAQQAEREIRARWGGDRPYIARRAGEGTSQRNAQIRRDHRAGERIGLLCRRYRLSRQRIHQILAAPDD